MNTTNTEQPFEPGDIIEYRDRQYLVMRNNGPDGIVRDWPLTDTGKFAFFWSENCRKVGVLEP